MRRYLIGFACFVAAVGSSVCAPLLPMEPASQDGPKITESEVCRYTTLAIKREASALILAPLTLERGAYANQVQVSDRQGRWSNVLSGRMAVDTAPDGDAQCS